MHMNVVSFCHRYLSYVIIKTIYFVTQAGIDTELLTIALEPEAAAMYVKHLPVERIVDGRKGDVFQTFSSGSQYIVVDAGGLLSIFKTQFLIIHHLRSHISSS